MATSSDFFEAEVLHMTGFEKLFGKYPEMYNTKELAFSASRQVVKMEKIIRPAFLHRLLSVLLLFFSLWFFAILLNMLFKKILIPITSFGLIFVATVIWILIWNSFLTRKYNYKIRLNKDHIEIDKKVIPWSDIQETQILHRRYGRGRKSFLVIFCKNGQIHKHSLFNFGISDKKLSTLIEAYKQ